MKKIIPIFVFGLISLLAIAQVPTPTANQNSIVSTVYQDIGSQKPTTTIQYSDGLGRVVQTVNHKGSGDASKDIISSITYDVFGRVQNSYIPAPAPGNDGSLRTDITTPGTGFYNDSKPFAFSIHENSALGRPLEQYNAGAVWHNANKSAKTIYAQNAANEVRYWTVETVMPTASNPDTYYYNLKSTAFYGQNKLYKTTTADENTHVIIEYKDVDGRLIQRNVQVAPSANQASDYAITTYIYDDFGRLAAVVQPLLFEKQIQATTGSLTLTETDATVGNLIFSYLFDGRGRVIRKRIPGAGYTYMVYNKLDQPIMTQNARQYDANLWSFVKYDVHGRAALVGQKSETLKRNAVQVAADAVTAQYVARGGAINLYSTAAYPSVTVAQVQLTNYYDDYTGWVPSTIAANTGANARGMATGARAKTLNPAAGMATEVFSAMYYDNMNRAIKTIRQNTTGATAFSTTDLVLDLIGKIKKKTVTLIKQGTNPITTTTISDYTLDHQGRTTLIAHKINAQNAVELVRYDYDDVGRLVRKRTQTGKIYPVAGGLPRKIVRNTIFANTQLDQATDTVQLSPNFGVARGGNYTAEIVAGTQTQSTDALQDVDYQYNVRNWLTCVNCGTNPEPTLNKLQNDLFAMGLLYEQGNVNFNGNISTQKWISKNAKTTKRSYQYSYDAADRLLNATYSGIDSTNTNVEANRYNLSGMTYDKNGNIKTLVRNGLTGGTPAIPTAWGLIDNLKYDYENELTTDPTKGSNRLTKVTEQGGVINLATAALNQQRGDFRDGANVLKEFDYYSDGSLKKDANKNIGTVVYNSLDLPQSITVGSSTINYTYDGAGRKLQKRVGTTTTDYDGEIVYVNNQIDFVAHEEGRLLFLASAFVYEYHYLDHLGNLRVAYRQSANAPANARLGFEPQNASQEEAQFVRVADVRTGGMAYEGNYAAELRNETGPSKTLAIRAGEKITASVWGHLAIDPDQNKKRLVPIPFIVPETTKTGGIDGNSAATETQNWVLKGGIVLALNTTKKGEDPLKKPSAYLQIVVTDSVGKPLHTERRYLDTTAVGGWQQLNINYTAANATEYIQVNIANASARTTALFDNLTITETPPVIVQENHYDPWGVNLVGIEKELLPVHRYQYNGKEKLTDLGINNYDYGARHYDAALGRWFTIDPLAEKYKAWSAYNYTYDNPANNIDPDGRSVWSKVAKVGFKVGKTALKEGVQSLKKGATWADAVSDIIDDVATVANSSASLLDRVVSGLSLASELLPISAGDVKDLYKGGKKLLGVVDGVGDVKKAAKGGVYTLSDESGTVVRTGRTKDLKQRKVQHESNKDTKDLEFNEEHRTDDYAEQRGLENKVYNDNPQAQSANGGLNKIKAISDKNDKKPIYEKAATEYLKRNQ
jgi:RHS repeat-associated protein